MNCIVDVELILYYWELNIGQAAELFASTPNDLWIREWLIKRGVAVILGGDFVIFGKTGGFVDIPKRVPTLGLDKRS